MSLIKIRNKVMNKIYVVDIDLYGKKNELENIMETLCNALEIEKNFSNEKIWKYKNTDIKFSPPTNKINSKEKLKSFIVRGKLAKNIWFYSIPNIVIKNNSYNPQWITEIGKVYPNATICISECSDDFGVYKYKIQNGQFHIEL